MASGPKQPARKPGVQRRQRTTAAGPKGSLRKAPPRQGPPVRRNGK